MQTMFKSGLMAVAGVLMATAALARPPHFPDIRVVPAPLPQIQQQQQLTTPQTLDLRRLETVRPAPEVQPQPAAPARR